ncbi:MAG: hypothetical protein FWG46_01375 [Treponema sp.]|nr:hypothetical protein [Treponema sp.]
MKRNITMMAVKKIIRDFGIGSVLLAMLACEQPFKAGLGGVVDIRPPTITLESPVVGDFIWGDWEFFGEAEDDYKLAGAQIRITNYGPTLTKGGVDLPNPYYGNDGWYDLPMNLGVQKSDWRLVIDTRVFDDGDFKVKLRVWDEDIAKNAQKKPVETEEIAFFIKNDPPHITMALPPVIEGTAEGQLGSKNLNYDHILFPEAAFPRVMDSDGLMVGMITDSQGINRLAGTKEYEGAEIETFPPQIRFWQLNHHDDEGPSHLGVPIFNVERDGVPTTDQLPWELISNKGSLTDLGVNNIQFTYPIPVVNDRYYGFQIRAQSRDIPGTVFEYPKDSWSKEEWDLLTREQQTENSFVIIYVRAPDEFPILELWKLEDITNFNGWVPPPNPETAGHYQNVPLNEDELDGDYVYVDRLASHKRGPFEIRIKTTHSEGVNSAAIYYEKDTGEKGRFIWDRADSTQHPGFPAISTVPIINTHYNSWGLADPHSSATGETPPTIRSFIFTHTDTGSNLSPNGGGNSVAGRSKIQQYMGDVWLTGGSPRIDTYYLEERSAPEEWRDLGVLPEGNYTISVFARGGMSNTLNYVPFTFTLSIDRVAPEIALQRMTGGYIEIPEDLSAYDPDNPVYTVNGVIRPQFQISDLRPEDSRIRTATSKYFVRDGDDDEHYGYEQRFIVIHDGEKDAMEGYLGNNNPWLPVPASRGELKSVGSIPILKDGPIFDSSCLIKTSTIYYDNSEDDTLDDGKYWIYVFARDNAFNVGYRAFPILVSEESDKPRFNFRVGAVNENVKDPNFGAEDINGEPISFESGSAIRNKFGPNSVISLRLNDDDSLDLGDSRVGAVGISSVSVSMVGSHIVGDAIEPWNEPGYQMSMSQAEVKAAFGMQETHADPQNSSQRIRLAVTERDATINQFVLLTHLKNNRNYNYLFGAPDAESVTPIPAESLKHNFQSLPDGLYRITISVSDYTAPDIKLIMPENPRHATAATRTESFWIAVDNTPPTIDNNSLTPATGDFISATETVFIKGKVSDVNGPIEITGLRVLQDGRTDITGQPGVEFGTVGEDGEPEYAITVLDRNTANLGIWEYDFSIPIRMGGRSGSFTFETVFIDRFRQPATLQMRYSVDDEPPTVGLSRRIETFERDVDDVILVGYQYEDNSAYQSVNKRRLANKVISFTITDNDNFGVAGLRWWFLPANVGSNGSAALAHPGSAANALIGASGGRVLEFDAYPSKESAYAEQGVVHYLPGGTLGGAYGEISLSGSRRVVIDTERLLATDGEYRLHIIAIDAAGNISRYTEDANKRPTSSIYQEVFLLQEEDRPYFGNITPSNDMVVSDNGMILRGTIFEDDGFLEGENIVEGSVKVWLRNNDTDSYTYDDTHLGTYNAATGIYTTNPPVGYIGPVTVPVSMLGQSGSKNINFNGARLIETSDQAGLFTAAQLGVTSAVGSGNGRKHIIIEATDASYSKIAPPAGGTARPETVARRKHFTFIYDTVPPTVRIDYPETNQAFGREANEEMYITGFFEDVNLVTDDDGRYHIEYRLESWEKTETETLPLAWVSASPFSDPWGNKPAGTPTNGERIYFRIPADEGARMLRYETLDSGTHMLTISVTDAAGRTGSATVTFLKDEKPPNFEFTNITTWPSVTHNPAAGVDLGNVGNWWVQPPIPSVPPGLTSDEWDEMWNRRKLSWLNARDINTGDLLRPLSVIYYDADANEKPVLTGTFDDDDSDVDMSTFMYWFDGNDAPIGFDEKKSVSGTGRNYRWEIWLTNNGTQSGTALSDGIHTIRFTISDKSGNTLAADTMYAFRIDSKLPETEISNIILAGTPVPINDAPTVFGRSSGFGTTVFSILGTASDANVKEARLRIVNTSSDPRDVIVDQRYNFDNTALSDWTFGPGEVTNPPGVVVLNWRYDLPRTLYEGARMPNGAHFDVIVTSVDEYDLESEEAVWTFTKDTSAPAIRFSGVQSTGASTVNPSDVTGNTSYFNRISSETVRIQGSVIDDTSAISALESEVSRWNWAAAEWVTIQPWGSITDLGDKTSANVQWTKDLSYNMPFVYNGTWWVETNVGPDPGDWEIVDTGTSWDTGDVVSATGGTPNIWQITKRDGPDIPLTGRNVLQRSEGLYSIQVRAKDSSVIGNPPGDDWNPNDGTGNPALSQSVYFYIDRNNPNIAFEPDVAGFYSSVSQGGELKFSGTVNDANRYRSIHVDIIDQTAAAAPVPGIGPAGGVNILPANANLQPSASQEWAATFTVTTAADGHYRVRVTATDMANNVNVVTKNFTLDNRPPDADITLPSANRQGSIIGPWEAGEFRYASEVVMGGEDAEIRGTTRDTSNNRTESGVESIWYHLGFLDDGTNLTTGKFPTQQQIERSVLDYANTLVPGKYPGGISMTERDRGQYNELFDAAAKPAVKNAWFQFGVSEPPGFVIANSNIYDWIMRIPQSYPGPTGLVTTDNPSNGSYPAIGTDVGGLKQYDKPIWIKGKHYNISNDSPRMTLPVPKELLDEVGETGVVRMPLYIRVADKAGNISYTCRDIWIYPDGDIPRTTVLNPQNSGPEEPRGGTISADGIARNNWAVNSVVFRVKVDGDRTSTTPPGNTRLTQDTDPGTGGIVTFDENRMVDDPSELNLLRDNGYDTYGWYYANPEAPEGSDEMPWNFSFNTQNEIKDLIHTQGFRFSGTGDNNRIRVYMEVFAFRGNGTATIISIGDDGRILSELLAELGSPGTPLTSLPSGQVAAMPYIRIFFMQDSAPVISDYKIGSVMDINQVPGDDYVGQGSHVFRDKFAIRATLNSGGNDQDLSQISIRRPQEENRSWVTVWDRDTHATPVNPGTPRNNVAGVKITTITEGQLYYFDMYFDSIRTSLETGSSNAIFSLVKNGDWRNFGGRYPVEVRIRDGASPPAEAIYVFDIGIDNFAPVSDPRPVSQSNKRAAGTNQDFMGRVFDYSTSPFNFTTGAPRDIDSVYVWFTKNYNGNEEFININNGSRSSQAGSAVFRNTTGTFLINREVTVEPDDGNPTVIALDQQGDRNDLVAAGSRIAYPAVAAGENAAYATAGGWVRHINESLARPGSRMLWIPNRNWDITWVLNIDTTVMPDGLITLNYVVTDKAGNASYHTQENIFIRNRYPQIDRVTLYTDNDGIGAVYTTHDTVNIASTEFILENHRDTMFTNRTGGSNYEPLWADDYGYLNSGFISKNEFVGFRIESSLGNDPMSYRLQYVERGSYEAGSWVPNEPMKLTRDNLELMIANKNSASPAYSNVYTIAWQGDYNSNRWQAIGAPTPDTPIGTHFVLQVNNIGTNSTDDNYIPDSTACVWSYRPIANLSRTIEGLERTDPNGIYNLPVLPNDWDSPIEPGHGFNFQGSDCFEPDGLNDRIGELNGSYPGDAVRNDPTQTAFFLIKAWDRVNDDEEEDGQLYDAVVIGMNVYLRDIEEPTIRLYDLNPYTETEVTGNNVTEESRKTTMENALFPRGIGENILRGGLYNVNTERELLSSGHVEPRNGTGALQPMVKNTLGRYDMLPADGFVEGVDRPENTYYNGTSIVNVTRDMVSGKVILRGYAHDNQLIREIRVHIGEDPSDDLHNVNSSAGKDMAILRIDEDAEKTITQGGETIRNPLFGILQPVPGKNASVYQELHWKDGHSVEWAYVWDTEIEPNDDGSPAGNIGIWVAVIDQLGNNKNGLASSNTEVQYDPTFSSNGVPSSETFKNMMRVDIVPYITGFLRYGYTPLTPEEWDNPSPRYATRRSRQGWFSFFRGENNIAIQGYNLLGGTMPANPLRILSGTGGATVVNLDIASDPEPTVNRIVFNVPNTANSGQIVLNTGATVGGSTEALNHRSNPNRSWNSEYNFFTAGSDLWTNKPHVHIWRSQQNDPGPGSGTSTEAPRTVFGSVTATTQPQNGFGLGRPAMALEYTGTDSGRLTGVWDVYGAANVYYGRNGGDAGSSIYSGLPNEPYVGTDVSFYNGSIASGAMAYAYEGDGNPNFVISHGTNFGSWNNVFSSNSSATNPAPTKRFQHNRVARSNGQSHAVTYDAYNNNLRYGRLPGTGTGSANSHIIDGNTAGAGFTGSIAASSNAGLFSAIDYTSNNYPIIAYYDVANDTLRLAYADREAAEQTNRWTRKYVLDPSHPLYRGSGRFVSIKVDKNNGIHLAFQNSSRNTLVYAYATARDQPFTAYTVDNVVRGGVWTNISVDNEGNPWIVYGDTSRVGNYDGARIAYRTNASTATGIRFDNRPLTDAVTGADITGWEAVTVPSNYLVNNDRLSIEVWPPTVRGGTLSTAPGWHAAVGYGSDRFRLAYFYRPTWQDQRWN